MYVRHLANSHVLADVYPFAEQGSDPRFLASSPHYVVVPEGEILYNGQVVTVDSEIDEAVRRILAIVEAERISGKIVDRSEIVFLAGFLAKQTKG